MINRKKIKKTILFLIAILLTINYNIKNIFASGPDESDLVLGGYETDSTTGGGSDDSSWTEPPTQGSRITNCNISRSSSSYSKVYGNKYDTLGNKYRLDDNSFETLAGTYIGINIYEKKEYTKTGSYNTKTKIVNFVCTYKIPTSYWSSTCACGVNSTNNNTIIVTPLINYNDNSNSIQTKFEIKDDFGGGSSSGGGSGSSGNEPSTPKGCYCAGTPITQTFNPPTGAEGCPETKDGHKVTESRADIETAPSSSEIAKCKERATPLPSTLTGSYKVTYKDSNDIDETNGTAATIVGNGSCQRESSSSGSGSSGSVSISENCTFSYNREKTCINIQTSKVRYIQTSASCDNDTEYTITMRDGYWKYFIPLNANSKNGFSLSMNPNNQSIQSVGMCQNIIDNYDNYRDLIKPITGNFETNETKTQSKRKIQTAGGCYYQSTISIPVIQKFYNELSDGYTFKGFNFYYKSIDVNNPFPNGLPNYSIWKEVEETQKMKIEFGKETYVSNVSSANAQKIRLYNQNNLYTSWLSMKNKGNVSISQFIEKENIVKRLKQNNSYKLGCGPNNTNLETTNPFYQKECIKS